MFQVLIGVTQNKTRGFRLHSDEWDVQRASMVDRDSSSGGTRSGSSGRAWPAPAAATSFATVSMDSAATSATELLTPAQGNPRCQHLGMETSP